MITQEEVRQRFHYNPTDGSLVWITHKRRPDLIGTVAGSKHPNAHIQVYVNCKKYWAHRLIWLYQYGYMPKMIDHINGNPSDNRIENLRECTQAENLRNVGKPKHNTSGIKGVSWSKAANKWEARCGKYLGLYETKEEAAKIVQEYREQKHKDFAHH
jgi:hypothetical protein